MLTIQFPSSLEPFSLQIHYITESIRCCGAGTAADTTYSTALISSNMEMLALQSGRKPRVVTAMTMLKQMLFRFVIEPAITLPALNSFQTPRTHRCCSNPWWCWSYWTPTIHHSSAWFYRQTPLRNNGFRQPCSHGHFWEWLETWHGGNFPSDPSF